MTKTEQLDELFVEWKAFTSGTRFIKDGIINEQQYDKEENKILFIAKEANWQKEGEIDLREHWNEHVKSKFDTRIAEWAWGIQNDFKPFDEIYNDESRPENLEKKKAAIKKIAIIDVNKCGGGGKTNHINLHNYIQRHLQYLHRQIEIIKPNIIISGLKHKKLLDSLFTPEIKYVQTGYVRCVFKWNDCKVIDFYHPSYQTVPAASYCLLQNIYQSSAFTNL